MNLRLGKLVLLTLASGLGSCAFLAPMPLGNPDVPQPAKPVETDRYLGRWFELYRYDAAFQKDCEAVTADYSSNADGTIRVLNTCRKGSPDGPVKTASGKAKLVDQSSGAKLKVSFFGPFYGDYWVLDHDENYRWSIVGEPSGRYLWILSRDPKPDEALKAMLRLRVEQMGYDWSLVRETKH
jgi:apolipoprotein D and lipocalin family protein